MKVIENGKLVEKEITVNIGKKETKTNEPVDRSKIDDNTKLELVLLYKKLPEIKPVLDILLGKKEVDKIAHGI